MTRETALKLLSSAVPSERLDAARYLQFWALPSDVDILRRAIAVESVGWVRRALDAALKRLGDERVATIDLDSLRKGEDEAFADLSGLARAWVAQTVVHELEPIIGVIEYHAQREFEDYEKSKTKAHIARLAKFIRAIEALGNISQNIATERIDIGSVLADAAEAERVTSEVEVKIHGPARLILRSNQELLRIVVGNGLKNACEATLQSSNPRFPVLVLYGANDEEAWVHIEDRGMGLPSNSSDHLFELGKSTKEGHLGVGLTLSAEATKALGGEIRLKSDLDTTRLELTIPIKGERN